MSIPLFGREFLDIQINFLALALREILNKVFFIILTLKFNASLKELIGRLY